MNLNNKLWEIHCSCICFVKEEKHLKSNIFHVILVTSRYYQYRKLHTALIWNTKLTKPIKKNNKSPESIVSLTQTLGTMENFGWLM